jgi:ArsR family transcriptional regulator
MSRTLHGPFAGPFTPADADRLTNILKALADPTRLRILGLLGQHESLTPAELVVEIGNLTQPTVAHHIAILDRAGLIRASREGVYRPRQLDVQVMAQVAALLNPGGGR